MSRWAQKAKRHVAAVTVNHGLRPEAKEEAEYVSRICACLGVPHEILYWENWNRRGNLQNAARDARKHLISDWAQRHGINTLVTGHTKTDQAETFLMRLARGSGVDGLAAIHPKSNIGGLLWLRPLLAIERNQLRSFLTENHVEWVNDPSNDDPRFTRVKIRQELGHLAQLGLSVDVLAQTAERLQLARAALEHVTLDLARNTTDPRDSGSVRLKTAALFAAPTELQYRLVAHCLNWVASSPYRPRLDSLKRLVVGMNKSDRFSLGGCLIAPLDADTVEISREASAMETATSPTLYDGRWQVSCAPEAEPFLIRPLGADGILHRPNWRQSAESRNTILSSPSIWRNNELKSVPLLDKDLNCTCQLISGVEHFFSSILTH